MKKLQHKRQNVKKSVSQNNTREFVKETDFQKSLYHLMRHISNVLHIIKIEENPRFFLAQRKWGHYVFMAGVDVVLSRREKRVNNRLLKEKKRVQVETDRVGVASNLAILELNDSKVDNQQEKNLDISKNELHSSAS